MSAPEREAAVPAAAAPPPAAAAPSPGALLRQARERAGLGAEDLAGQLKLAKGTLEALERDDFAALSEPVYVRGYYRKIAKVLPVAEADLISAYNARVKPAPAALPQRPLPLARGVASGTSRHSRGPGIGLLIGALVVVAVLFALVRREPPRRLADILPAPVTAPAAPVAEPAPVVVEPPPGPAAATSELPAGLPAEPAEQPAPATTPETRADASPAVAHQLVLEFTEASFVRVEDQQGRTLRIGLVRGGERHALDGTPPYTVFLGNARNVSVFYGGAPVDFSAHVNPQNDTARFTVP